jgi:hypothetical protein
VVLAAAFGAPGCVVAFAGPVVDAGREPRGSDAPLHRLAQTFASGVGLAGGVLLAGLLWATESPAAAINATSAAFALAALIYGIRGLLAWRTAHGSRLRS